MLLDSGPQGSRSLEAVRKDLEKMDIASVFHTKESNCAGFYLVGEQLSIQLGGIGHSLGFIIHFLSSWATFLYFLAQRLKSRQGSLFEGAPCYQGNL